MINIFVFWFQSSYDANTFSETLWRENAESHVRKVIYLDMYTQGFL